MDEQRNSQSRIEIRGVETIEEFFRPEFVQNTQSLGDINDDSDDDFMIKDVSIAQDNAENVKVAAPSRGTKRTKKRKKARFPSFSDNSSSGSSSQQIDIAQDENKANFRNMGFPNMNYLDPEANGPPLQQQTYYRNF